MAAKVLNRVGQIIDLVRSRSGNSIGLFDTDTAERELTVPWLDVLVLAVVRHFQGCGGSWRDPTLSRSFR